MRFFHFLIKAENTALNANSRRRFWISDDMIAFAGLQAKTAATYHRNH
jgi:hypothetical protein